MGANIRGLQDLKMDNWQDILFTLVPELRTMCGFQQNNPYHVFDVAKIWQRRSKRQEMNDIGKTECYTEDEDGRGHFYGQGWTVWEKSSSGDCLRYAGVT